MEVFCLLGGWDYEGFVLLGVYHTQKDAQYQIDLIRENDKKEGWDSFDFLKIDRRVIGATAKMGVTA